MDTESSETFSISSWLVLIVLSILPFSFLNAYSSFEVFRDNLLLLLSGSALISWGIETFAERKIETAAGRIFLILGSFALYLLISLSWANIPATGLIEVGHLIALTAVAFVIASPSKKPIQFRHIAVSVSIATGLTGLFGILDLAGINQFIDVFTPVWDPPGATGAFDSMENAVTYYVLALPILLSAIFEFKTKPRALPFTAFLLGGFHFALVASWTIAGIFAAVCLASVVLFMIFQDSESSFSLYPIAVFVGIIALFMAVVEMGQLSPDTQSTNPATSLPLLDQITEISEQEQTGKMVRNPVFSIGRMEAVSSTPAYEHLLSVSADLFTDKPLLGHGPGGWWYMQTRHPNPDTAYAQGIFDMYPSFRSPHSAWFKLGTEYGLTGLFLFSLWLIALFAITFSAIGSRAESSDQLLDHWALFTTASMGVVFAFFTPIIEFASSSLLWISALGLLGRYSAELNNGEGWSESWTFSEKQNSPRKSIFVILIGVGLVGLAVPTTIASYYRGQGDNYMVHTYYRQAIDRYEKSRSWYPKQGDILYNISLAHFRIGGFDKKSDHIKKAAKLRPHDSRILSLLSHYYTKNKNDIKALETGRDAFRYNPNNVEALKNYSVALRNNHQYDKAAKEMIEFLKKDPPEEHKIELHKRIAELYTTQLENNAKAKEHYEKAIKLLPHGAHEKRIRKRLERVEKQLQQKHRMREGKPPKELKQKTPGIPGKAPTPNTE